MSDQQILQHRSAEHACATPLPCRRRSPTLGQPMPTVASDGTGATIATEPNTVISSDDKPTAREIRQHAGCPTPSMPAFPHRSPRALRPPRDLQHRPRQPVHQPQFTSVLKDAGVAISMDGMGRCMDKIFIERLWHSQKYEAVFLARALGRLPGSAADFSLVRHL